MSLQQPVHKMSKSHEDALSRVQLADTPEEVRTKIMAARTDSTNAVSYDPEGRPGVSNLLDILSALDGAGKSPEVLAQEMTGAGLRALKVRTADAVVEGLAGVRDRYLDALSRRQGDYLNDVAEAGASRARANADETMAAVRAAVGL